MLDLRCGDVLSHFSYTFLKYVEKLCVCGEGRGSSYLKHFYPAHTLNAQLVCTLRDLKSI